MKKLAAFTLIELLVVVAIIGLLIAILLPSLAQAKKRANTIKCLANVRALDTASQVYFTDYRSMFPYSGAANPALFWINVLKPYGDVDKIRICPQATGIVNPHGNPGTATLSWAGGAAGADPATGQDYVGSYGLNGYTEKISTDPASAAEVIGYAQSGYSGTDASWFWTYPFTNLTANIPLFTDSIWYDGWPHGIDPAPSTSITPPINPSHMWRFTLNRHNMAVNVSFLDGHAESVTLKNLWNLKWNQNWGVAPGDAIPSPLPKVPIN